MKIRNQLTAIAIAVGILGAGEIALMFLHSSKNIARTINYTGIVRGGTQRLVKLTFEQNNVKEKNLLPELTGKLDNILNALVSGNQELKLKPIKDKQFQQQVQTVRTEWESLKKTISSYDYKDPNSHVALLNASETYFDLTNEMVSAAEAYNSKKSERTAIFDYLILLIDVAVIGYILWINRRIINTLNIVTSNLGSSSAQIATTTSQQEQAMTEQATSVNETTTTIEELGATSRQTAEQAMSSTSGAQQAIELTEKGNQSVSQTIAGIQELQDQVTAIADQIIRLSEQTGQIGMVSDLVAGVAKKTNMLALNAAVEAARAGEQGKGFAVVAGEIRKLADQSKKSASKINTLVEDIQSSINSTVMVTDQGQKVAVQGLKLAEETSSSFNSIAESVNNVFLNSQQITMSAKQQAVAVQQVVSAMNAINLGSQETVSGISQIKAATGDLKNNAAALEATI
ncbi:MAG: methyl-accepting chemotaxis protein [Cyanobacteria bacterium P01_F01_bin.143]